MGCRSYPQFSTQSLRSVSSRITFSVLVPFHDFTDCRIGQARSHHHVGPSASVVGLDQGPQSRLALQEEAPPEFHHHTLYVSPSFPSTLTIVDANGFGFVLQIFISFLSRSSDQSFYTQPEVWHTSTPFFLPVDPPRKAVSTRRLVVLNEE